MLSTYKEQQDVERGFRFIKDNSFHLNEVYLKKPSRIDALMMVMVLCLMVYNNGQHQIRETLKQQDETLPNQLGKKIKTPTLRWIFQMMRAINLLKIPGQHPVVVGVTKNQRKIIDLFGLEASRLYQLS